MTVLFGSDKDVNIRNINFFSYFQHQKKRFIFSVIIITQIIFSFISFCLMASSKLCMPHTKTYKRVNLNLQLNTKLVFSSSTNPCYPFEQCACLTSPLFDFLKSYVPLFGRNCILQGSLIKFKENFSVHIFTTKS